MFSIWRSKLKEIIKTIIKNEADKKLLELILKSYELINVSLLGNIIQPETGVPQGSVCGPTFFLI